jgi:hypothetical protein
MRHNEHLRSILESDILSFFGLSGYQKRMVTDASSPASKDLASVQQRNVYRSSEHVFIRTHIKTIELRIVGETNLDGLES